MYYLCTILYYLLFKNFRMIFKNELREDKRKSDQPVKNWTIRIIFLALFRPHSSAARCSACKRFSRILSRIARGSNLARTIKYVTRGCEGTLIKPQEVLCPSAMFTLRDAIGYQHSSCKVHCRLFPYTYISKGVAFGETKIRMFIRLRSKQVGIAY